jgi:hypothetical protein
MATFRGFFSRLPFNSAISAMRFGHASLIPTIQATQCRPIPNPRAAMESSTVRVNVGPEYEESTDFTDDIDF